MDCSWNNPNVDPYRGTVAAAVARYDLPPPVAREIIAKAEALKPDSVLAITRDSAVSYAGVSYALADMHYGKARLCTGPVTRSGWAADRVEHAMVYCSGETCIAVPFICHNVSRLTPLGTAPPPATTWGPRTSDRDTNTVAEPGALALVGMALVALAWTRRGRA